MKMALHRRHLPLPALMKDVLAVTFSERFQQEKKLHLKYRAVRETGYYTVIFITGYFNCRTSGSLVT